ncbi:ribosomal protein S18 acetylase RimI-like enzyme [Paenibacillus cellulosilyticus]|uniref:Ribosomal protein S18 acetylase RimI-like enzyme n=1 Tax=Paenibacillus cellulosilyticus TaxID=375489 RepID=A0A2V2YZA8_9BACL|nr:GNAT family N-acetyltransferase [Paenibacillus cellulosilyticus]PWW08318.1 ribosomal protein S18 acetylase RimI-like enzyme [Paenibacillus cellulosilyticus]QKS47918.1 GNAT family N-acetyltransferase [Paenibacillus cellulosilyticus]
MDFETMVKKISEIRKCKGFLTNAFFTAQQLGGKVNKDHVTVRFAENTVIILEEEEQLVRLYFYAADLTSLQQVQRILVDFKGKPIIADVVGRDRQVDPIVNGLQLSNFYKCSTLIRMKRLGSESRYEEVSDVTLATQDRVDEIMDLLYLEFDSHISHLPNRHKLLEAINNKEVTLVIQHNEIAGLAYFERLGEKLVYLYQLVVDKRYRGQGVADRLLKHQFDQLSKDVVCQLWVESSNVVAINKYERYHFAPDGLVDSIMMFKGENNG